MTLIEVSLQLVECYFGDIVLSVPAASGIIRNQFLHTCYWPLQSTFVCVFCLHSLSNPYMLFIGYSLIILCDTFCFQHIFILFDLCSVVWKLTNSLKIQLSCKVFCLLMAAVRI